MKKSFALLLSFLITATTLSAMDEECSKKQNIPHKLTLEEKLSATRLVTNEDHTNFLKNALDSAQQDVMISSYRISAKRLFDEGIVESIKKASKRGVNIYIYYNKSSPKEYDQLSRISQYCVRFEEIDNHSKCVIIDRTIHGKRTVAIGSYNWLSEAFENSSNASMVLSGTFVQGLGGDIWDAIKFYQSLKYDNQRGVNKFCGSLGAFTTGEYRFEEGDFYYTLSTPQAHGIFLDEVIQKAQKNIVISSPFIRLVKLQSTLTPELLGNLQRKDVNIELVTLPSPCRSPKELREIFSYLKTLTRTYPNFVYTEKPNMHEKTLVVDKGLSCEGSYKDLICAGSYNWLSAVDDLSHSANNFEMSVGIRGTIAHKMLQTHQKTASGKVSLKESQKRAYPFSRKKQSFEKFKKTKISPAKFPSGFEKSIKIFSGEQYNKEGHCVRLNGDYLRDGRSKILYFKTPKDAKQAAWAVFSNAQKIKNPGLSSEEEEIITDSAWIESCQATKIDDEESEDNSGASSSTDLTPAYDEESLTPELLAEIDRIEQNHFSSQEKMTDSAPSYFEDDIDPAALAEIDRIEQNHFSSQEKMTDSMPSYFEDDIDPAALAEIERLEKK